MTTAVEIEGKEPNGRFFVVTTTDGIKHSQPVEPGRFVDASTFVPADLSTYPQEAQDFAAGYWTTERVDLWKSEFPWVEPTPPVVTPHLNGAGLARFSGTAPIVVAESIRMAGVTRVSKGRYRVIHEEAQPSDQYSVFPSVFDANPRLVRVTARTTTYVELRVTDLAGVVQDPTEVSVKTERVINS